MTDIWEKLIAEAEAKVVAYRAEAGLPPLVGKPTDFTSEQVLAAVFIELFDGDFSSTDKKMAAQVMMTAVLASRNAEREHGFVLKDLSMVEILQFVASETELGGLVDDRADSHAEEGIG